MDQGVSASRPVSDILSRRRRSDSVRLLTLHLSEDAEARAIVVLLMSAEEAGLEGAQIALGEGKYLQIALPNSVSSPPLQMADVYLILDEDRATVFSNFEQFAAEMGEEPLADTELTQALQEVCKPGTPCQHVVVSLFGDSRSASLEKVLRGVRNVSGEEASVRLALREGSKAGGAEASARIPLANAEVRERLQKQDQEFRHCLRRGADEAVNTHGTVALTFTITRLGIVFEVTPDPQRSTIIDPNVVDCIVERITKTQFSKPEAQDLTVDHTFRF